MVRAEGYNTEMQGGQGASPRWRIVFLSNQQFDSVWRQIVASISSYTLLVAFTRGGVDPEPSTLNPKPETLNLKP